MDDLEPVPVVTTEDDPYASAPFFRPVAAPPMAAKLNAHILAGALHSQATDAECAALFGVTVKEFQEAVHSDPELQKVYRDAPLVGRVALKKAQMTAAVCGDKVMLKHLGEHVLKQVDAQPETKVAIQVNQLSQDEIVKRWGFVMEKARREEELRLNPPIPQDDLPVIEMEWESERT